MRNGSTLLRQGGFGYRGFFGTPRGLGLATAKQSPEASVNSGFATDRFLVGSGPCRRFGYRAQCTALLAARSRRSDQ